MISKTFIVYTLAILTGLITGYVAEPHLVKSADVISEVFMSLLKLVSLPIIFLSITSVATGVESIESVKVIGKKVVQYTLLTTAIAAAAALALFLIINPVGSLSDTVSPSIPELEEANHGGYLSYLIAAVPSNILTPFVENNVLSVLLLALLISAASFKVSDEQRKSLHSLFSSMFSLFMKMTSSIVTFMPIALWAFVTLFVRDLGAGLEIKSVGLYLLCVVAANVVQGLIVLPLFLKWKKISPLRLAKAMWPALGVAFFTKSSNATIPMAVRSAQERASISSKVANFVFPLCTTINMNGCAAFILITTLFVSMSYGIQFSPVELILWVIVATIAAVGNAGVPMGCYFLSSAFLAAMNVPLHVMGVILPFYALIDALETAVNVWSDSCVAAVVDKELAPSPSPEPVAELHPAL